MLRRGLLALTLAGLLYAVTPLALAQYGSNDQQSAPAGEASEHGPGHHRFDPAKRTEMLTKQLNLTSDQQAKEVGTNANGEASLRFVSLATRPTLKNDGPSQSIRRPDS